MSGWLPTNAPPTYEVEWTKAMKASIAYLRKTGRTNNYLQSLRSYLASRWDYRAGGLAAQEAQSQLRRYLRLMPKNMRTKVAQKFPLFKGV